ncbi:MAG: VWA domain-containing protein [Chloroflexi bacterium]|nr:VWA domain-containing protein [Chloroflexota bacterium]
MKRLLLILFISAFIISACSGGEDDDSGSDNPTFGPSATTVTSNSTLNAGEIDDNDQFDHYLAYQSSYSTVYGPIRNVDVRQRQVITVVDGNGLPVHDARVMIFEGQNLLVESRTYADGRTLFFPNVWSQMPYFDVIVQKDDVAVTFELDRQSGPEWVVDLSNLEQQIDEIQLDVVFQLDATGSMADEIRQLQDNIVRISSEINQMPHNIDARYGLVHYRDRGDEYVTRRTDFVRDVQEFQQALNAVQARGGGDKPESLNEGLHEAVQSLNWRDENTLKLIFLVADAPPHLDYSDDYDYSKEIVAAAWRGIKIHPIASSGLRDNGEYIFRQIAHYTMGHFVFLTYEDGAAGSPGTERTDLAAGQDGNYSVEQLDDLVLRLITDEIAALGEPVDAQGTWPQLVNTSTQPTNAIPNRIAFASAVPPQAGFSGVDKVVEGFRMLMMVGLGAVVGTGLVLLVGRGKRKKPGRSMWEPGIYE